MKKSFPKGIRLQDFSDQDAVAAQVDGVMVDLSRTLGKDASITFIPVHSKKRSGNPPSLCSPCHGPGGQRVVPLSEAHLWSFDGFRVLLRFRL